MTAEPIKHRHILKRVLKKGRKTSIFMCADSDCSFVREADYLVGKKCACPYCEQDFIISRKKLLRQGLLHCNACSKFSKRVVTPEEILLEKVLNANKCESDEIGQPDSFDADRTERIGEDGSST